MAKRGRKPAPTPLKLLAGERPDRVNLAAPKPTGRPEAPAHLDDAARAEWDRLVPKLEKMGVLASIDGAALGLYCEAHARYLKARESIESLGLVLETDLGGVKKNPAVEVLKSAEDLMVKLMAEFGMTPSSRSRLSAGAAEGPKDQLAEFLARKRKA